MIQVRYLKKYVEDQKEILEDTDTVVQGDHVQLRSDGTFEVYRSGYGIAQVGPDERWGTTFIDCVHENETHEDDEAILVGVAP